ncbi:MAG: ferritin-like domain-containing protein [Deltaproteobacteria bacterium]|nr:ferritin-like domain-containing protein [Deltaproteobacteria bacterium]
MSNAAPELSLEGIVQFAIRIEEESKTFYEEAHKRQLSLDEAEQDAEVIALLAKLIQDEVSHRDRLMKRYEILPEKTGLIDDANLKEAVERIVHAPDLPEASDAAGVLQVAHRREIATRDLYNTLLSLSQLSDLYELFDELAKQEQGHANRIRSLLKRLEAI